MSDKKIVISNKQARRDFFVEKSYEAGLQLKGNEVKSLRNGKANLKGSFARVDNGEAFLYNMHINPYEYSREDYNPVRPRKLLLHKSEIYQIEAKSEQKGYSLIVLKVYFWKGYAKAEIALAKGKKLHDKRASLKKKEASREMEKALRYKNK